MIDRKQEQRLERYKRNIYCRWTVEKYILLLYLDLLVSFVHLNTKEKTSFSDKNFVNRKNESTQDHWNLTIHENKSMQILILPR